MVYNININIQILEKIFNTKLVTLIFKAHTSLEIVPLS